MCTEFVLYLVIFYYTSKSWNLTSIKSYGLHKDNWPLECNEQSFLIFRHSWNHLILNTAYKDYCHILDRFNMIVSPRKLTRIVKAASFSITVEHLQFATLYFQEVAGIFATCNVHDLRIYTLRGSCRFFPFFCLKIAWAVVMLWWFKVWYTMLVTDFLSLWPNDMQMAFLPKSEIGCQNKISP